MPATLLAMMWKVTGIPRGHGPLLHREAAMLLGVVSFEPCELLRSHPGLPLLNERL